MSRLPAVKAAAELSDSLIGLCLFCMGSFGLIGLAGSPALIRKVGSRIVLCLTAVVAAAGLCFIGFSSSVIAVLIGFAAMGIGISMLDVAMNTQGELYDSIGSVCATARLTAGLNFVIASAPFLLLSLALNRYLLPERRTEAEEKTSKVCHRIPLFILVCAVMALLAYAAEGSLGGWGALYPTTVKEASVGIGALVYGIFSCVTFAARLVGDPLRKEFGEIPVIIFGSVISFVGMVGVLSFSSVWLVLISYAIMGLGLAPVVPTLLAWQGKTGRFRLQLQQVRLHSWLTEGFLSFRLPSAGWLSIPTCTKLYLLF